MSNFCRHLEIGKIVRLYIDTLYLGLFNYFHFEVSRIKRSRAQLQMPAPLDSG
jgi:hypothetical protein